MTPREKLIELRTRHGLSQARFAKKTGLSRNWVLAIEQDRRDKFTKMELLIIDKLSDERIFKLWTEVKR